MLWGRGWSKGRVGELPGPWASDILFLPCIHETDQQWGHLAHIRVCPALPCPALGSRARLLWLKKGFGLRGQETPHWQKWAHLSWSSCLPILPRVIRHSHLRVLHSQTPEKTPTLSYPHPGHTLSAPPQPGPPRSQLPCGYRGFLDNPPKPL